MAAGMTLREQDLPAFSRAFDAQARKRLAAEDLCGEILSDGGLAAEDLNLELAQELRDAGPWGQGFPEPMFDGRFRVLHQRLVGERHLKLRLAAPRGERVIDAIAFNQGGSDLDDEIHVAYRLDVNEYRDRISPQLIIEDIQSAAGREA